jgi:octaprenyl-diphosphate synthase
MSTAEALKVRAEALPSPIDRLHALVAGDMDAANRLIHARMGSAVPLIPDLAAHLVDSGGKRLRPLLTLAAARLGGYAGEDHVRLAAAVEFIHTATLLHDDVVDASALRRGKMAANIVWGNKPSVLVGDYLFSRAFQLMVEARNLDVLDVLAGASAVIAEGEVLQLKSANNLGITEADYLRVVSAKTAALFSAAAEAGALVSRRDEDFVAALRSYGHNLGIAFQLVDDALDYSGRQAQMGKSVGDDFREAKATLPLIVAYARAGDEARRFWHRTIETGPQHEGDLRRAIAYMEDTGAIAETRARAHRYAKAAADALADYDQTEIGATLVAVAEFCVGRGY